MIRLLYVLVSLARFVRRVRTGAIARWHRLEATSVGANTRRDLQQCFRSSRCGLGIVLAVLAGFLTMSSATAAMTTTGLGSPAIERHPGGNRFLASPDRAYQLLRPATESLPVAWKAQSASTTAQEFVATEGGSGAAGEVKGPADSPVWGETKPARGKTRTNGERGKDKEYYEWDFTHNDIEVYDGKGRHKGSKDPTTVEMTKPPVKGRRMNV